jgi:hypothetical protein
MEQLRKSFMDHGINDQSVPLILIFDEARTLCEYEAYDGARIYDEHSTHFYQPPLTTKRDATGLPVRSFSNFRALRRALHYLSVGPPGPTTTPTVFAVFTDTTSRITNFQPTAWNDPSMRVIALPEAGQNQFPPIFVFSSIDVHSRIQNPAMCTSSHHEVADLNRLLKFGRAGWYSTYLQRNTQVSSEVNLRNSNLIVNTATSKLVSARNRQEAQAFFDRKNHSPANLLKMIAVLAPRLALTVGPYTLEASELIASHLAVLTRTDNERHFLRTVYPSEPILAEASAQLTHGNGWAHPLSALLHYVRGGIVEAGFRGELITKIVCLMAMDNALSHIHVPRDRWRFSRPITVSHFLNNLVVPLRPEHRTFSEGLKGVPKSNNITEGTLNVDDEKLRRFLDGHVFFNHFIRVEVKLSYSMLVHAWNRGAAILCMTNTKGIDHVIPVMLDTKNEAKFGPLHGPWQEEHIQQARLHVSYILINSKNYASGKDHIQAAWETKFSSKNLEEYGLQSDQTTKSNQSDGTEIQDDDTDSQDFDVDSQHVGPNDDKMDVAIRNDSEEMEDIKTSGLEMDNVYLSIIQDFGKKRLKDPWITVTTALRTYSKPRFAQPPLERPPLDTQFIAILQGVGPKTYQCLKDNLHADDLKSGNQFQGHTRMYLKELTSVKVDYVDQKDDNRIVAMQNIPVVYGESMLGSEEWMKYRSERENRRRAEPEAHGGADESMDEVELS